MAKLPIDYDKYGERAKFPIVDAFHGAIKDVVRKRLDEAGVDWRSFVFDKSYTLLTAADFAAVEAKLLKAGHRFDYSAVISVQERPEAYKPIPGSGPDAKDYAFEHPDAPKAEPAPDGRQLCGIGDNVVRHDQNTSGIARYVRTSAQVMDYLQNGVPADTIAIIDDSGGTLTAPILERFKGVICLGGTVRSHLGILSREYGIPCLMNAKIRGIREGDTVELESVASAKTAEAYQTGQEMTAHIWKRSSKA
jgi:hypothetical protein